MLLPEISARLTAQSLVATGFTVLFGKMPASPDKVIVLYETGGLPPDMFLGEQDNIESAGIQVVVRGVQDDYVTPRAQAEMIYQAMGDWGGFTAGGTRYLATRPQQSPFMFQRDTNERLIFAFNVIVTKELSSTS